MSTVTLRQLEYFLAVVEHQTLTAAAGACHVSTAGLALALNELENNLGLQLTVRQKAKGVRITAAGERVAEQARVVLQQANELTSTAEAIQGRLSGPLRVGCHLPLSPWLLPPVLDHFTRMHPAVDVGLAEGTPEEVQDLLLSARLDAGFVLSSHLRGDELEAVRVREVRPRLVLPAGHRLAGRESVSFDELQGEPCVLASLAPGGGVIEHLLADAGLVPLVRWRTSNTETIRAIVARGLGYSILVGRPHGDASYDGRELAYVEIADPIPSASVVLAFPAGTRPTAKLTALVEFCRSGFADSRL